MSKTIIHGVGHTPSPDSMEFMRMKLNSARTHHHIGGAEYAEVCGVGLSTAYKRTEDISHMTISELYTFCRAIGCTPQELLSKY